MHLSFVNKEKEAIEISKYWLDIIGLTHRADDDAVICLMEIKESWK